MSLPPTMDDPAPRNIIYVPRVTNKNTDDAVPTKKNVSLHQLACGIKDACNGAMYDVSHFNDLPRDDILGKIQMVCTRGGRLPYLFLLLTISFASFFLFVRIGRGLFGPPAISTKAVETFLKSSYIPPRPSTSSGPIVGPRMIPSSSYRLV